MNLQFYFEKLENSEAYKNFIKKNKDAYFYSGFFCLDKKGKDNQVHLDFFIPSSEEVFSFKIDGEIVLSSITIYAKKVPEEISMKLDLNLDVFEKIILDEIEKKEVKKKVQKLLLGLQSKDKEIFLIATVFMSGMGLVKLNINVKSKEISEFEKKSIFDMISVLKKK